MKIIDKYPFESFIGSYLMDKSICDKLIDYYKKNKHLVVRGIYGENNIDSTHKDSYEVNIGQNDYHYPINLYRDELQNCLNEYLKKYKAAEDCKKFNICEDYHMQYYKPGGGYKIWHNERGGLKVANRYLVFMTYLNDVDDGGTTDFDHYGLKIKPEKNKTLIWPAEWTHAHTGSVLKSGTKYIITGWFDFAS